MPQKKTILLDLDGVLNTYNGKYLSEYIPPLRSGAHQFVKDLSRDYEIKIFTSRKINLTKQWLKENNLGKYVAGITKIKEPSWLILDDRCITFKGDFNSAKEEIKKFKVWYK